MIARPAVPTLPWTAPSGATAPTGGRIEVMASAFTLTSRRHTFRMMRVSMALRKSVLTSPGALGISLVARPLRRQYYTLSSWTDRAALDAFVRTSLHREAMRTLGPAMATGRFTFWQVGADAPAPTWEAAHERLAAEPDRA
ncbi:DUF3291 domain-containing protein [Frankia sp. AgKG'84/4]|uniref:DUF3291 domain-containing protein n=1 Tax=Frankia sp. AgKG'84/4 TaxID=573490 RepID=UPI00200E15C1|nr:DUF3291 domain-containing protein [Frankia sp. AgKG'84/4]MCL9794819.1 DUF3291 domain-containing protein [Frankia sp. AgKG'84/4]